MHAKISGNFPDYTISICKSTTDACFLFKLKTSKNCKGGKSHYDYDYSCNLHLFIFSDISRRVENCFQKILRPP